MSMTHILRVCRSFRIDKTDNFRNFLIERCAKYATLYVFMEEIALSQFSWCALLPITFVYLRMCRCDLASSACAYVTNLYVCINRNQYSVTVEWNWFHGINGSPALSDPRHLVRVAYCTDNRINGVPRNVTRCDLRETEGPSGFLFVSPRPSSQRETASSKIDSIGETIRR